ncbi:MAG: hypothetical protein U1D30_20700 [Planctomycetota bacterium]
MDRKDPEFIDELYSAKAEVDAKTTFEPGRIADRQRLRGDGKEVRFLNEGCPGE